MTDIDEAIRTYLLAIEIEGKSPKAIASYGNSLEAWGGKTSCGPFVLALKTAEYSASGNSG